MSLDKADADPARLWTHLITALSTLEPQVGTTSLAALKAHPDEIERYALPRLLDELPRDGPDLAVVLDDYHLAENSQVNGTLDAFLHYRPARLQLVISTRSDPALGVPRLRASGKLLELRASDLRFDDRELAAFLDGVGVPGLTRGGTTTVSPSTPVAGPLRSGCWHCSSPGRDRGTLPRVALPGEPAGRGLPHQ